MTKMKTTHQSFRTLFFLLISVACFNMQIYSQKVVFLHHSTGNNVYYDGNVMQWISDYNTENNTHIDMSDRSFPNSPYPWSNYPYDYWNLWVDRNCDSEKPSIECIESLVENYNVIIYKHCFPGANILAEAVDPDITSSIKTLGNYKLQYRALRDMMDGYPSTIFIVWTLAPLHRLSTNPDTAARAREFANWVKEEWLTEDGKEHKNIFVFDFWGNTAELNNNPVNGEVNCLRYDYEKSHTDGDSHPNQLANETLGPIFAQFIVNCIQDFDFSLPWEPANPNANDDVKKVLKFLYDIKGKGILTGQENLATDVMKWTNQVVDITGRYPGLLGEDFSYGDSAFAKRQKIVNTALDYWNKGGLVTISWHQVNPTRWNGSIHEGPFTDTQVSMSQSQFNQLFIPESELLVKYLAHIDTIAQYLKKLESAGVVVLWRPFHEMNGGWFWWGRKNNFTDLWRGMYNRFTYYHNLNNLIWVWGPNIGQDAFENYYPGDEYVDIVGLDGYVDIIDWDQRSNLTEDLDNILNLSRNNMASFTELGWLPDLNWIQNQRPEFLWFLCWWTHITDNNSETWINKVYHNPYAINRGDFVWKDFPIILVKEFEDRVVENTGEAILVAENIASHFYTPPGKTFNLNVSANNEDILMEISDNITFYPAETDIGEIVFTVTANNSLDSIHRQFTVTLHESISSNTKIQSPDRIAIFPNPAEDYLHISNMEGVDRIMLYDLYGREIYTMDNMQAPAKTLELNAMQPG